MFFDVMGALYRVCVPGLWDLPPFHFLKSLFSHGIAEEGDAPFNNSYVVFQSGQFEPRTLMS